ncbi:hypothetical protein SLEP1_g30625 [Rubroshorea leprosula]|uniref:Cell division control protein 24 OB domain-containing protein n=1 Tax=Rubroshorea leprosula TaxID=152421 RepID=A0AAV5K0Q4_9ROSI|nr:hypothetical protein SLEP1_g30625 [Rubroshorea leprosula]
MEIDCDERQKHEDDPFLAFVEYARSMLSPEEEEEGEGDEEGYDRSRPGWSWIASQILKTCVAYSSGVTYAILLSDVSHVCCSFSLRLCSVWFVRKCG